MSYGDYEKEFIKKLWILNGLHLQLAYYGLANNKRFMHELFDDVKNIEFSKNAINSLGEAYLLFDRATKDVDVYKQTILHPLLDYLTVLVQTQLYHLVQCNRIL